MCGYYHGNAGELHEKIKNILCAVLLMHSIIIIVDIQVNGQEGEGPKMVPKRQIQLKKKEEENTVKEKKLQVRYPTAPLSNPPVSTCPSVCLSTCAGEE